MLLIIHFNFSSCPMLTVSDGNIRLHSRWITAAMFKQLDIFLISSAGEFNKKYDEINY